MKVRLFTVMVLSGLLWLFCLLGAGCAKQESSPLDGESGTGEKEIGFYVRYSLLGMSVRNPSEDGGVDENSISDINLYLVNEMGDVVSFMYLCENDADSRLEANIHENERYSVYAVANAGKRMPATTLEQIEKLEYEVALGDGVLMAGKTEPQMLYNGAVVWINIERCISRIILKADYSGLNDDVEIQVKSISLKNVPKKVSIFGENRIENPEFSSDGEKVTAISREDLEQGITFYQYENMQGTLQPDNDDCTKKVWPQQSIYSSICSYVQMEASYSSPRKKGDILYRFYLGSDMTSNYDVPRNASQTVTISFNGDGAVDENTWRVDDSDITSLVTGVEVNPSAHRFIGCGGTVSLVAEVIPQDAANKRVTFRSDDTDVAVVDESGTVTAVGEGECMIIAGSCDGTSICDTCSIVVVNPHIAFAQKGRVMYDGETVRVPYDIHEPADVDVELVTSNGNAQIMDCDSEGFTVKAITPGTCSVIARVGDAKAVYELDIRKLSIELKAVSDTAYNHFYYDFDYTITPEHAAGLGVKVIADPAVAQHIELCGGNRMLVSTDGALEYPASVYDFAVEIEGRSDVSDHVQIEIKESSLADIRMVPNLNKSSNRVKLDFATSPRAFSSISCRSAIAGLDIDLSSEQPVVNIPLPCSLNGRYDLKFVAEGDDGRQVEMDALLEVYEAVYIVAVSKHVSSDNVSQRPIVKEYINEVSLRMLSYPGSALFEEGELNGVSMLEFEYILDGKVYSDPVPDICFTHRFTFRNNDEYAEFPSGTWEYDKKGVPGKYMEFYPIQIMQPFAVISGERYIYLNNRTFGSGFCDESTKWTEIFDIVY